MEAGSTRLGNVGLVHIKTSDDPLGTGPGRGPAEKLFVQESRAFCGKKFYFRYFPVPLIGTVCRPPFVLSIIISVPVCLVGGALGLNVTGTYSMNSDGMGEAAVTLTPQPGENCAVENVTFKMVATDKNRFWITSIKPTVAGNTVDEVCEGEAVRM